MNIGSSISVVVPVFNEEENIYPLAQEIGSALKGICNYEIIFVNAFWGTSPNIKAEIKRMIVSNGKFKYMGRFKRYNFEYCCSAESSLTTKSPSIINKEKQKKKIVG